MDKAKDLFESYMLLKFTIPKWGDYTDIALEKMWQLYKSGVAYPLMERDSEGRRVIFVQPRKLDPKFFTLADAIHLGVWIAKTILEEEETQISGIITVVDQSEVTFGHIRLFSVSDIVDFVTMLKISAVGRQKGIFLVSLPSFASFMLEIARKALSDKLKKRIHLVDQMEDMKLLLPTAILPLEFGGTVSEADMMKSFKKVADERDDVLKSIQDGVDWERVEFENQSSCSLM